MNYSFFDLGDGFSQCFTMEFIGPENLFDTEKPIIEKANVKRQQHFSTGRFCARQALKELGFVDTDILRGPEKEPLWPSGVIGSISHSKSLTGAIIASTDKVTAIGLDIETIGGVKPEMWDFVFTPNEQAFINTLDHEERILYASLIFSFKESFYKFQYPITKLYVDFKDVEFSYVDDVFNIVVNQRFTSKMPDLQSIVFKWTRFDDQVICLCYLNN